MPAILYSANSKQVSRFQRKGKLYAEVSPSFTSVNDPPFKSIHSKDSNGYLLELCCSNYPIELENRIRRLPQWKLSAHAFFALILKNFIRPWYGEKIPTSNNEFIVDLFDLFENTIESIHNVQVSWELILCEELPQILRSHLMIMHRVLKENLDLNEFYQLYLYKYNFPRSISSEIIKALETGSEIQDSFLHALIGDLLLDKVIDKVVEPFILLDIIKALCERILKPNTVNDITKTNNLHNIFRSVISMVSAHFFPKNTDNTKACLRSEKKRRFVDHSIFQLLEETFEVSARKPFLYYFCKNSQIFVNTLPGANQALSGIFSYIITSNLSNVDAISFTFLKLRSLVFPNDNKMGPGKDPPSLEEYNMLKRDCSELIFKVCQKKHYDKILGITKSDCCSFIDSITRDRNMNKFIVQRVIEYSLTWFPSL